jgi:hypothetical protein
MLLFRDDVAMLVRDIELKHRREAIQEILSEIDKTESTTQKAGWYESLTKIVIEAGELANMGKQEVTEHYMPKQKLV